MSDLTLLSETTSLPILSVFVHSNNLCDFCCQLCFCCLVCGWKKNKHCFHMFQWQQKSLIDIFLSVYVFWPKLRSFALTYLFHAHPPVPSMRFLVFYSIFISAYNMLLKWSLLENNYSISIYSKTERLSLSCYVITSCTELFLFFSENWFGKQF